MLTVNDFQEALQVKEGEKKPTMFAGKTIYVAIYEGPFNYTRRGNLLVATAESEEDRVFLLEGLWDAEKIIHLESFSRPMKRQAERLLRSL